MTEAVTTPGTTAGKQRCREADAADRFPAGGAIWLPGSILIT
jgi:hypothetical protein